MITLERLRDALIYDADTGIFEWREKGNGRVRKQAGFMTGKGYRRVCLDQVEYAASRLAWFYVHGTFPDGECDHIDGNRDNNRISNLRDVTHAQNLQNKRVAQKRSKTGFMGVWKKRSKFAASIRLNGKQTHLGVFDTPEDAHAAYIAKKRAIHQFATI